MIQEINDELTEPLRLLLSNIRSSKVMSAETAPDSTDASSARPLGVATPASESICMLLLAWIVSWLAGHTAAALAELMKVLPLVPVPNAVGVHSAALGFSIFYVQ